MRRRTLFAAFATALLTAALVFLGQIGANVRHQIDSLATANSDNTQWSLAQLDVELLALKTAIFAAGVEPQGADSEVRLRFDILYSRVNTVSTSPLYAALREEPGAVAALDQINAYLADGIPLIDRADDALRDALPDLSDRTVAIRPIVRQLTLEGVSVLAGGSDSQRRAIAETLSLVSILTAALLLILLVVLALLIHYERRARERAREEGLVRSRLASIISTSLDAILVVGRDGRVMDFNGAEEEIFGYSRAEAIGAQMQDLNCDGRRGGPRQRPGQGQHLPGPPAPKSPRHRSRHRTCENCRTRRTVRTREAFAAQDPDRRRQPDQPGRAA